MLRLPAIASMFQCNNICAGGQRTVTHMMSDQSRACKCAGCLQQQTAQALWTRRFGGQAALTGRLLSRLRTHDSAESSCAILHATCRCTPASALLRLQPAAMASLGQTSACCAARQRCVHLQTRRSTHHVKAQPPIITCLPVHRCGQSTGHRRAGRCSRRWCEVWQMRWRPWPGTTSAAWRCAHRKLDPMQKNMVCDMRDALVCVARCQWHNVAFGPGSQGLIVATPGPRTSLTAAAVVQHVKHRLRQSVEWPLKHDAAFTRLGLAPPRGVLMHGPPGCSKTSLARAVATSSGVSMIPLAASNLYSMCAARRRPPHRSQP